MEITTVLQIIQYSKDAAMVYLNYTNLDDETQERLTNISKQDIENRNGESLRAYAKAHHLNYETILYEEAVKNLYNYKYVFNI